MRFSTIEQIELLQIFIKKRSGATEPYSREKVLGGLRRSTEKRNIAEEQLQQALSSVERDIQRLRKEEVESREVGEIIMRHLRRLDEVAYIRFASVYRSFADVETFQDELKKLFPSKNAKANKK